MSAGGNGDKRASEAQKRDYIQSRRALIRSKQVSVPKGKARGADEAKRKPKGK